MSGRAFDDPLRLRALEVLGPHGDALGQTALETGTVSVDHDVRAWEGSHGTVRAHRVVLAVPAELHARLMESYAARDGIAAALAAAMAERAGHTVADVSVEIGVPDARGSSPYRDPSRRG